MAQSTHQARLSAATATATLIAAALATATLIAAMATAAAIVASTESTTAVITTAAATAAAAAAAAAATTTTTTTPTPIAAPAHGAAPGSTEEAKVFVDTLHQVVGGLPGEVREALGEPQPSGRDLDYPSICC